MMKALTEILLLGLLATVYSAMIEERSIKTELARYQTMIREVYDKLAEECPEYIRVRRELVNADHPAHLEVQKVLLAKLERALAECRQHRIITTLPATTTTPTTTATTTTPTTTATTTTPTTTATTTTPTTTATTTTPTTTATTTTPTTTATTTTPTTTATTTTPTTTATTTTPTTTATATTPTTTATTTTPATTASTTTQTTTAVNVTEVPVPKECYGDVLNISDGWRTDTNGSNIKPGGRNSKNGYACDQHKAYTSWFRFTGDAGSRLLDTCPKKFSCGTGYPFWTDEKMPEKVGVPTKVNVYGVIARCKSLTRQVIVMRCSPGEEANFIYQQTTRYTTRCQAAFCSM